MNNCFVKKLDAIVSNPNLKPIFENYKDYAEAKGGNVQYVQIIGSGLAVESLVLNANAKVLITFKHGNTDGKNSFCLLGKNASDGNRIAFAAYGDSQEGQSSYNVKCQWGSGSLSTDSVLLTAGSIYTIELKRGTSVIYNADGTTAGSINVGTGSDTLASLYVFNNYVGGNFSNVFTVMNAKIIVSDEIILDVYPAVDGDGYGCLYDDVNQCYYHANSGQLTVGNFD